MKTHHFCDIMIYDPSFFMPCPLEENDAWRFGFPKSLKGSS